MFGTRVAPQAAYTASATVYVTDRAGVQPRPQPKPAHTECGMPFWMVFTPEIHIWITTHLPNPERWKAESGECTDKMSTIIGHRSEKVRQPRSDVSTTELHRQPS